jgi:hypothetical protein
MMDSERFAFTVRFTEWGEGNVPQIRLYTYGYPPNALSPVRPATITRESFAIAPNPTNGNITIKGPFRELKSVSIYDVLGRRVQDLNLDHALQTSVNVEIGELPTGSYFLRFIRREGTEIVPLKIVR